MVTFVALDQGWMEHRSLLRHQNVLLDQIFESSEASALCSVKHNIEPLYYLFLPLLWRLVALFLVVLPGKLKLLI